MAVAFQELPNSPTESWTEDGFSAQRMFIVDWADRYEFVLGALGSGDQFGLSTAAGYPNAPGVLVVTAKAKPFSKDMVSQILSDHSVDIQEYKTKAHVTLTYKLVEDDIPPDNSLEDPRPPDTDPYTFITYTLDFSTEMLRFTTTQLKYEPGGGIPVGGAVEVVKRVPVEVHRITFHRVTNPPISAIRNLQGKVNSLPFVGAGKGTMLFDGPSLEREWAAIGGQEVKRYWAVTYIFLERRVITGEGEANGKKIARGWNWVFRSHPENEAGWRKINLKDDEPLYQSGDFTDLFREEIKDPDIRNEGDDQVAV